MYNCSRLACRKEFKITDQKVVHVRIEISTPTKIIPALRLYCCQECFDLTIKEFETKNLFTAIVITRMDKVSDIPTIYEIECRQKFDLKMK